MENQTQNQRRRGIISKFSSTYGFIKSKNPANPSQFQTFFAHLTNVEVCDGDIPREGDTAEFNISPLPAKEGKCRYAINIHVFTNPLPNALGGVSALAGEPLAQKDDKAGV